MASNSVYLQRNIDKVICDYISNEGYSGFKIMYKDVSKSYCSVAKLITVNGTKDGRTQEEQLFVKTLTDSKARNERLNLKFKFQREVFMYQNVLLSFRDLQSVLYEENGVPLVKFIKGDNDYIILENLVKYDFIDASDRKFLDINHIILMMKELGKFHGLSFVMKIQKPEKFNVFKRQMDDKFFADDRRRKLIETTWNYALSALEDEEVKNKALMKGDDLLDKAINGKDYPENGVICHGDFNVRNVLFKYGKDLKPISMMMIDYQQSFYGSPVRDIFFTIASSISNEDRNKHYTDLLNVYYTSLSDFLSLFKLNVSSCYSREEFNKDLNIYFPYALANNLVTLRVICSPKRSDEDMVKIYDNPQGTGSIFIYNSVEAEAEYNERINGLMKHYVDMKYI